MTPVLAEPLGRANGLMGGKGGSMHLTSAEHGVMGSCAIIGSRLTIANGAAWSVQYRGSGQVAVGWGAEIGSLAANECFWSLDGPIQRIPTPHIPLPAADSLEDLVLPSADLVAISIGKAFQS